MGDLVAAIYNGAKLSPDGPACHAKFGSYLLPQSYIRHETFDKLFENPVEFLALSLVLRQHDSDVTELRVGQGKNWRFVILRCGDQRIEIGDLCKTKMW